MVEGELFQRLWPDPRRPPLLVTSRLLGDRLLLGLGEAEDPVGAANGL